MLWRCYLWIGCTIGTQHAATLELVRAIVRAIVRAGCRCDSDHGTLLTVPGSLDNCPAPCLTPPPPRPRALPPPSEPHPRHKPRHGHGYLFNYILYIVLVHGVWYTNFIKTEIKSEIALIENNLLCHLRLSIIYRATICF